MEFLKKLFKLFIKKGGKFIQTNIKSIEQKTSNDETIIKSENEEYKFEKSVLHQEHFQKILQINLVKIFPLDTERGYHVHFKDKEN